MYDSPLPSMLVSSVFGVMGLAIVLALLLFIIDHVEPIVERLLGGASFVEWLGGIIGRKTKRLRRHRENAAMTLRSTRPPRRCCRFCRAPR